LVFSVEAFRRPQFVPEKHLTAEDMDMLGKNTFFSRSLCLILYIGFIEVIIENESKPPSPLSSSILTDLDRLEDQFQTLG